MHHYYYDLYAFVKNCAVPIDISCGYTHLGFGVFRRVNGLGLVQLRFHVTLGDAVTR